MALLYVDSFDHYTTVTEKWTSNSGCTIVNGGGRGSSKSIQSSNNSGSVCQRPFATSLKSTLFVGCAVKSNQFGSLAHTIYALLDASGPTWQFALQVNAAGRLVGYRGRPGWDGGTISGATGTIVLLPNTYYYIEIKLVIHDTTGSLEVKVNGVTDINVSGVDTRNGGGAGADVIRLFEVAANNVTCDIDDLYICDDSGSAPLNTFLGDVRVEAIMPTGNGNSSQFVGSDSNSADNYALVDEIPPNGDTDYVASSAAGEKDTYAFGDLTVAGTVLGVQVNTRARKDDAGSRSIVTVARLSGTEEDSAAMSLADSYAPLTDIRPTKPGGGAWATADVNGAEFGVKVNA